MAEAEHIVPPPPDSICTACIDPDHYYPLQRFCECQAFNSCYHWLCIVHWMESNEDMPCNLCGRLFTDPRIERFIFGNAIHITLIYDHPERPTGVGYIDTTDTRMNAMDPMDRLHIWFLQLGVDHIPGLPLPNNTVELLNGLRNVAFAVLTKVNAWVTNPAYVTFKDRLIQYLTFPDQVGNNQDVAHSILPILIAITFSDVFQGQYYESIIQQRNQLNALVSQMGTILFHDQDNPLVNHDVEEARTRSLYCKKNLDKIFYLVDTAMQIAIEVDNAQKIQ